MNVSEFLTWRKVEHDVIPHRDAYDAQHLAQAVHTPGREVAKTVLLRTDDRHMVAVLPADKRIDFDRLSDILGGAKAALATEIEIAEHCPDCDIGVLPPFGSEYGMATIVDQSLAADESIVFEGNTHHEAIRMKFSDFYRLEAPILATFSV